MKLLLALQFYSGDMDIALDVAQLVADIEKSNRALRIPAADVEFLFSVRFDTNIDTPKFKSTKQLIESLWKTHVLVGRRKDTGWPDGCNSVWHETMMWSREMVKGGKGKWDAVLTFESDACPLTGDWIQSLAAEWQNAKIQNPDLISVGHLLVDPPHINGNALFDAMLLQKHPRLSMTPYQRPWDCFHGQLIVGNSVHTPLIVSRHGQKTIDKKLLFTPFIEGGQPVFHHGVKNDDARKIVRKLLKV